ncbi:protein of unknown function [Pseudonocardia thermophila]|uniref:DUF397 domain-containing protein n=1 Tax=Pseudonocardia thermophila TaxID=1848 RepID=A0A1M6SH77_PSETH|nr:DUF397 domain-containing protein [Pseudonocardia thermophila]SHK44000.1 protein of unknown function [Pseudonocardia thermophila]
MTTYRVSSFCCSGACVEVGLRDDGSAVVRDTKDPARAVEQECSAQAWAAFLAGAAAGEFDLPS